MAGDPVGGLAQAIGQVDGGTPAQALGCFAVVGDQALHFGLFRAQAGGIDLEAWGRGAGGAQLAAQRQDGLRQVVDPHLLTGAQVEHLPFHIGGGGGSQEARRGVGHVGEVTARVRAQVHHRQRQGLRHQRRDHGARRLARSVGVEGAHGHHRQPVGAEIALRQLVGANLGGRVGRLTLQRVVLVDGRGQRRAVHFGGRGVQQAAYACLRQASSTLSVPVTLAAITARG
jgi:hypothetical protein